MSLHRIELIPSQAIQAYDDLCFDPQLTEFHMSTISTAQPVIPGHLQSIEFTQHNIEVHNRRRALVDKSSFDMTTDQLFAQRQARRNQLWGSQVLQHASFYFDEELFVSPRAPVQVRLAAANWLIGEIESAPDHITIGMRSSYTDPQRSEEASHAPDYIIFDSTTRGRNYFVADGQQPVTNPLLAEDQDDSLRLHRLQAMHGDELLTVLGGHVLNMNRLLEADS